MHQFEKAIAKYQTLYDTVGPYYLSNICQPNGEKHLYDFLTSVYQAEYKNNFRILIIQDCVDTYDYTDLPGRAIRTLQKQISQIDISNFFVLVVTGNKNISSELDQVQKLYSTDSVVIQNHVVEEIEYNISHKTQDTFCVLPWIHLYVGTDGNVLPCCVADQQHPMGSIKEQGIDSILKSSKFNQLRANMLAGLRSKECSRCYTQEDAGLKSIRSGHNSRWKNISRDNLNKDGSINNFEPVYLDIRLSNTCNLKCRMCSGYFSSSIAVEEQELFNNRTAIDNSLRNKEKNIELNELMKYLPSIEEIYFAGGEPLIMSEHYKILNALIECNNTDLKIKYNTNFTNLVFKGQSVVSLWNKFSDITIGASVDAVGSVAEYIRSGTDWQAIEKNLLSVRQECPHVNFTVTSTVGFMNVASLIDLQYSWHTNKILDISKFSLSPTISPDHLTVQVLPKHHKLRLETLITNHVQWCLDNNAKNLAAQWQYVLQYMNAEDRSHFLAEFNRLTKVLDEHRNESFVDVFPEFQNLIYD